MLLKIYNNPVLKTAVATKQGDVIRFRENYGTTPIIAIFERCNIAANGVATEIYIQEIGTRQQRKTYDVNKIEDVTFEVIGEVATWL